MTTLREEIGRLAKTTYEERLVVGIPAIESAILAGVKLVLEQKPSEKMLTSGWHILNMPEEILAEVYHAMTRELLKELDRNHVTLGHSNVEDNCGVSITNIGADTNIPPGPLR